jgi:hypothetical protein
MLFTQLTSASDHYLESRLAVEWHGNGTVFKTRSATAHSSPADRPPASIHRRRTAAVQPAQRAIGLEVD